MKQFYILTIILACITLLVSFLWREGDIWLRINFLFDVLVLFAIIEYLSDKNKHRDETEE